MVEDHETERQSVKHIKKLVRLEIMIRGKLEGSYELVLQETAIFETLIKAQWTSQ